MQIADLINGSFEILGGVAKCVDCYQIIKDKRTRGVSWVTTAFFTSWGFWNLYYYPSLGQWVSFIGGLSLVVSNAAYLALMWRYRKN